MNNITTTQLNSYARLVDLSTRRLGGAFSAALASAGKARQAPAAKRKSRRFMVSEKVGGRVRSGRAHG